MVRHSRRREGSAKQVAGPPMTLLHHVATAKSEIPCRVRKLPGVGVIRRHDPLITAKPTPAASIKDEAIDGG